jgi:hypothetical protein
MPMGAAKCTLTDEMAAMIKCRRSHYNCNGPARYILYLKPAAAQAKNIMT